MSRSSQTLNLFSPRAIIIAGPNGAGKTTFAREYLPAEGCCPTFINADLIAAGLSPFDPEEVQIEAVRIMLERIQQTVMERRNFAVETTLSARSYLRMIQSWQDLGYQVELIFLELPSADLAVRRVFQRVRQGGHDVPEHLIRRRLERGLENLRTHYCNIVDAWQVYDTNQWPVAIYEDGRRNPRNANQFTELEGIRKAMIRAAHNASEIARQYEQKMIFWQDGRFLEIAPEELPPLPKKAPQKSRRRDARPNPDQSGHSIRYAIYTRQSVNHPEDFTSCEAQYYTCREYAQASGGRNLYWCGQRFDDEGHSGSTLDRPGLDRLRKVIDLGGIDRVYAVALDRIARSVRDLVVLMDEFEKAGVEVQFVHQPELTLGAEGRLMRHILASFAEFEKDMIASRIADSRSHLKKQGRRLAGKVPYGYEADPETKQLIHNPVEAPRAKVIFERVASGELPSQIAKSINELGWPTKIYHSKRTGKTTGGNSWSGRQIAIMVHNPVYLGRFADGSDSREGTHEPIIDQETFDAAQQQLASRRTTDCTKKIHHNHLAFRQKVVCPRCGRFLVTQQSRRRTTGVSSIIRHYYSCRSTKGGKPGCKGVSYPAWEVDQFVRKMFNDPEHWKEVFNSAITDEWAKRLSITWQALEWPIQKEWLSTIVDTIEFTDEDTSIAIAFNKEQITIFLDNMKAGMDP